MFKMMHMEANRRAIALLSWAFLIGLDSQAPRAHADTVDDYAKAEIHKRHIPGLSLAVLHNGQVVKVGAYGLANLELNIPTTPQTVFQIQSITKTFTSAAILLLMEEAKLSLEDPVKKHIEGTPDAWKDITLRHLLTHTSGIKDFINEPTASLQLDVTEEEVLKATAPRPLNFTPGEKWAYSNTNYHLLAMILRKLTGNGYGDFLRERIFTPLGMTDTRVVSLSAIIPNRASGYHWTDGGFCNGSFVAESILAYGGGGIVSTASDMAKWAAAFESEKLLKQATIAQAWTPGKLKDGTTTSYGLGWGIGSVEGHREIGHGGGHMTGFTSHLSLYPDDKLAVVVLTNSTSANPSRIARHVAGIYVPTLAPRPPQPIEDEEPNVTALLRDCLIRAPDWKLDQEKFTPELWKAAAEKRSFLQLLAKGLGQLKTLHLLSRTESGGLPTYHYRATFANGAFSITMSLTKDGKIAGFSSEEE
jgi:CubicO group peptidase (beta-lactamase class C family)